MPKVLEQLCKILEAMGFEGLEIAIHPDEWCAPANREPMKGVVIVTRADWCWRFCEDGAGGLLCFADMIVKIRKFGGVATITTMEKGFAHLGANKWRSQAARLIEAVAEEV
jgi:hypothetical protein